MSNQDHATYKSCSRRTTSPLTSSPASPSALPNEDADDAHELAREDAASLLSSPHPWASTPRCTTAARSVAAPAAVAAPPPNRPHACPKRSHRIASRAWPRRTPCRAATPPRASTQTAGAARPPLGGPAPPPRTRPPPRPRVPAGWRAPRRAARAPACRQDGAARRPLPEQVVDGPRALLQIVGHRARIGAQRAHDVVRGEHRCGRAKRHVPQAVATEEAAVRLRLDALR